MKKRLLSLLLAVMLVFSLLPASVFAAETPVEVTVAGTEHYAYAAEVVGLVNEARSENDAGSLSRNATLSELAMQRAAEIALYYESSHLRPDDSACSTIADGVYTGWTTYGENIAIGQIDPDEVMDAWMNSSGHRANILDTDYTQIGVGCFYAGGIYCWVQIFSNSTTNTATTSTTGNVVTTRDISILPANLNLSPTGTKSLELEAGESATFSITTTNPGFSNAKPTLIPRTENASSGSTTIAAVSVSDNGTITVTGQNPGTGSAQITVYDGQTSPLTLTVTVPEEETQPTETVHTHSYTKKVTSPTCTQKGYTTYTCDCGDSYVEDEVAALGHSYSDGECTRCGAKDPNYTEPTEPEPTETQPQPTEPEPTEPDPTEPPETTAPDEADDSGVWGDNLTWKLEGTTLTISGEGEMASAESDSYTFPWTPYAETVTHLIVEEGVTGLANKAFRSFTALTDVKLPSTFRVIGDETFSWCGALEHINLPEGMTRLGEFVFDSCNSLAQIDLPSTLTEITWGAFWGSGLVSVSIPDSVTEIQGHAFDQCALLEEAFIPDSVTMFGMCALRDTPNLTIYTYLLSYAHRYAAEYDIPVEILADEPDTVYYPLTVYANEGGTVSIVPESSPANRYVLLQVAPDAGYALDQIYYYYASDVELDLQFEQVSETEIIFFMPACEVAFEVSFVMDSSPFVDVKESNYFYEPVLWAVSNGVTSGIGNNRFGPSNPCTRAQVVTFLWRACGSPDPQNWNNPFTDVKESDYYYKAVLWAVENGITSGVSATRFGPGNPCTRAQVVTFLWRTAASPDPSSSYNPFSDVSPSAYYYNAVLWAVEYGITSGVDATHFGPNNTCTRGQIVTFLYKAFHG